MRSYSSRLANILVSILDWRVFAYACGAVASVFATGWAASAMISAVLVVLDTHLGPADPGGVSRIEAHSSTVSPDREEAEARSAVPSATPASPERNRYQLTRIVPSADPRQGIGGYGSYRTVCVRLCDGYFWPISNATSAGNFSRDRETCAQSCGGAPVRLFVHPTSTEAGEDMQDMAGVSYGRLKTAFRFRTTFDESCKCKAHPWEQQATDRHRLYALQQGQKKGADGNLAVELAYLSAKVAQDSRSEASRTKAANAQLVAAGVVAPASVSTNAASFRRIRATTGDSSSETMMNLGNSPPQRRIYNGATGGSGGGDWQSRAFGGSN